MRQLGTWRRNVQFLERRYTVNAWAALAMLWPLLGAAQAVLTIWNLAKFQDRNGPSTRGEPAPKAPSPPTGPRNLAAPQTAPDDAGADSSPKPLISLLVPARDEAPQIGACVTALLGQTNVQCEILLLDDHSSDGTLEAATQSGQETPSFKAIQGTNPEAGWTGKNWACAQLAEAANGEWFVFIDADVLIAPEAVDNALRLAQAHQLDMLCYCPRPKISSPAEGALIPALSTLKLAFLPFDLIESHPNPNLCAADGHLLVFSRKGYARSEGHRAIAAEVADDMALARRLKMNGGRMMLRDAGPDASYQMDGTPRGLWEALKKDLYPAFATQPRTFAIGMSILVFWHVLPPLAVAAGWLLNWPGLTTAGIVQTVVLLITRMVLAVRLGHPLWSPLLHPLAATFVVAAAAESYRNWTNGGITWKKRRYGAKIPLDLSTETVQANAG